VTFLTASYRMMKMAGWFIETNFPIIIHAVIAAG
jgi:hypothetical protein